MERSMWFSGGLAFAAILGVSFLSTPASAAVYDWTISGGDGLSGSGTITLSSTPTDTPAGTGYLVTGITGSLGSDDFSSRAVLGTFDSGGVNNIIYYPTLADGFVVDDFGLGIALANNYEIEIGAANGNPGHYNISCCGANEPLLGYDGVTFDLSAAAPAPEPTTWVMIIASLPVLGLIRARRSQRSSALAAAGRA